MPSELNFIITVRIRDTIVGLNLIRNQAGAQDCSSLLKPLTLNSTSMACIGYMTVGCWILSSSFSTMGPLPLRTAGSRLTTAIRHSARRLHFLVFSQPAHRRRSSRVQHHCFSVNFPNMSTLQSLAMLCRFPCIEITGLSSNEAH